VLLSWRGCLCSWALRRVKRLSNYYGGWLIMAYLEAVIRWKVRWGEYLYTNSDYV